jgi:hypothetical protein
MKGRVLFYNIAYPDGAELICANCYMRYRDEIASEGGAATISFTREDLLKTDDVYITCNRCRKVASYPFDEDDTPIYL